MPLVLCLIQPYVFVSRNGHNFGGDWDGSMVQTLRTLTRGLNVVRALNRNDGAGLRLIATETNLSRGAVHRLLETLVTDGYARKANGRYYLERKLHTLAAGLQEGDWVSTAQPTIDDLCRDVKWPISLARPNGLGMETCAGTDDLSPLRHRTVRLGVKMPMMCSASGRAYVAFQPDNIRHMMVEMLSRHADFPEDQEFCRNTQSANEMLTNVRQKGVATLEGRNRTSIVAVPIIRGEGEVLGALGLRYFTASLTPAEIIRQHLTKMQTAAVRIAASAPPRAH